MCASCELIDLITTLEDHLGRALGMLVLCSKLAKVTFCHNQLCQSNVMYILYVCMLSIILLEMCLYSVEVVTHSALTSECAHNAYTYLLIIELLIDIAYVYIRRHTCCVVASILKLI